MFLNLDLDYQSLYPQKKIIKKLNYRKYQNGGTWHIKTESSTTKSKTQTMPINTFTIMSSSILTHIANYLKHTKTYCKSEAHGHKINEMNVYNDWLHVTVFYLYVYLLYIWSKSLKFVS